MTSHTRRLTELPGRVLLLVVLAVAAVAAAMLTLAMPRAADAASPVVPGFSAVSAGGSHTCGLRETGVVECWGHNGDGRADAPAGSFSAVSAGGSHTCGLRETGAVECWGWNGDGQADAPAGRFSAVSAGGSHSCGLRETGAVECWGWNGYGQADAPAGRFSVVSNGEQPHSCGLRETGVIECWGWNEYGQTDAPAGSFSAISAGGWHSCGLRETGAVECWGSNSRGQVDTPAGSFSAISAGGRRSCGLRETGVIECWGWNEYGQTDAPAGSFSAISAGGWHSCGLRETGAVECWGRNKHGQTDAPSGIESEALIFADMIEPQTWVLGERISLELPRAHGGSGAITYSVIRRASGTVAEWGASGPLPAITFDEDAHRLHGVAIGPVGAGYSIELKATDADGAIERMSFTVELVEPQQAVEPDAARRIAKAYAPVLLRDRNEDFKPVAINAMLEQSALMQDGSDSPLRSVGDVLQVDLLRYNGRDMHLDLFHGRSGTNEKEWAKVQGRYPATVYARVFLQDGQHLIVQYWFFYVYNNGPGGGAGVPLGRYDDHEGDWEGIQLVFSKENTSRLLNVEGNPPPLPAWLGYASHNHGELRLPTETFWRNPHGTLTAPVVYVAEGSHASYAYKVESDLGRARDKDWDIARGNHPTMLVEGSTYQLQLIRGDEWWLSWTGRWGKDHIHGPKVQGRRWLTPICWPGWRTSDANKAAFAALRDC